MADRDADPGIVEILRAHVDELRAHFDVASLAVFGSAARGELDPSSDVDVLVSFRHATTVRGYFALKARLEELLQRNVDLVTEPMLKPRLRRRIEGEVRHVA